MGKPVNNHKPVHLTGGTPDYHPYEAPPLPTAAIPLPRRRARASDLAMVDVSRYAPLQEAYELAVRLSELHEAMVIVEHFGGTGVDMTAAITHLGDRLRTIQAELMAAVKDASGEGA